MTRGDSPLKSVTSTLAAAVLITALLLAQTGCSQSEQEQLADNSALATPVPAGMVRGTVLETMSSGGYTYVFMQTDIDQRWLAGSSTTVQVGDIVQTDQGMAMTGFTSKTLDRTFDVIYFVSALQNLSATKLPEGTPTDVLPAGHPSIDDKVDDTAAVVEVAELEPGLDIAYVYANSDDLANQQISLRGQVVKYNEGILGWNFIHIQDGSGDVADGSNDLTVTSKDTTAVGETIVVTGTIVLNKDFGSGYTFPVLLEDASFTVE